MYLFTYVPVYLFTYVPVYLFIYLLIYLSTYPPYPVIATSLSTLSSTAPTRRA
jgi:hypothetical protein